MSTFLRSTIQSSLRRNLCRPAFHQNIRQFHYTSPTMTVHNLQTPEEYKEALAKNEIVLLDCFATWCGPCKAIAPILAKKSNEEENKNVFFAKIDVDELADISKDLGIRAMPTFFVFKNGEKVDELVGANPPALDALIKKAAGGCA